MNKEFLPWSEKQHAAHPRTHQRYKVSARRWGSSFGKLPLDAISTGHIEKFKLLRSDEISSAGTNRDLAMLRFARRNIPLTETATGVLKRRLRKARGKYLFWHKCDRDKPLPTVQKAHETAVGRAKISPRFRLFDLRHTFGTRAAMAGIDLATLKKLMGHSHISVTMKYVHCTPEHKREAVDKLERFNVDNCSQRMKSSEQGPHSKPGRKRDPS